MAESILQTYLNEQHIKVADGSSVENLKKAITEVKKYLTRKKVEIIPFTLVALDPKVKDTDPVVQQVEKIIIKHWKTFANSVKSTNDKSTTYVRAVILESLSQLAKSDAATAALVWLTSRDVIVHYHLDSEKSVISGLLQELADWTEENGHVAWGISQKTCVSKFKGEGLSISAIKAAQVDEEALRDSIHNAIMHSGWGGENPSYPHQGNQTWSKHAITHLTRGITKEVNAALSQQGKSVSSISTSIQKSLDNYFAQFQPLFEEINSSFANSITANNKRSELLWWKQSLYSQSLNTSYRNLDLLNAAFAMALDLAEQVNAIYPESVDYLLRESLKDLYADHAEKERSLINWFEDSTKLNEAVKTRLERHTAKGEERKPLLNVWANALQSGKTSDFLADTGIDKKANLSASDLAVWLFHGLQAQKLATTK